MARKNTEIPEIDLIQSVKIDISLVDNNDGQIPGVNRNPRELDEVKYRKLKESLKRDAGLTAISELKLYPYHGRWVVIGGNMRLRAMRELGWTEVIAKPIPEDTPKEALNRYILLDNASFGKWDFDALANEWSSDVLSDCAIDLPEQPEPEGEEEAKDDNCDVDELKPEKPRSRTGDIYVLGTHRLICGDSTRQVYLDALMGDDQADIIISDPPYNVDYTGGTKEKKKIANDKMESSRPAAHSISGTPTASAIISSPPHTARDGNPVRPLYGTKTRWFSGGRTTNGSTNHVSMAGRTEPPTISPRTGASPPYSRSVPKSTA